MDSPPASYKSWLDDFHREVELQLQAPAPPRPEAPPPPSAPPPPPDEHIQLLADAVSRLQGEVLDHRARLGRLEGAQNPSSDRLQKAIELLKAAVEELRFLKDGGAR